MFALKLMPRFANGVFDAHLRFDATDSILGMTD